MTLTRRQFSGLSAAALFGTVTRVSAQGTPIKIGAVNPYSGGMAQYGDEVTRGFELAVDWINAQGGVIGRKVEIVRGNATSAQEGIAAVEQLVGRDKVDLLTGTYVTAISNAASESALNYSKLDHADRMAMKAAGAREGDFRNWSAIDNWTDAIVADLA